MNNTFKISFRLKNTYRANSIIYSLKSLPLIKKLLRGTLYASKGLKTFADIVSIIIEIGSIFIGKIIYFFVMFMMAFSQIKVPVADGFIHIALFLTIIGAIINTHMFNPTKDKYYAMFLMRMDAKEYTLANYFYFLLKTFVGLMIVMLYFGIQLKIDIITLILTPFFIVGTKCISSAITLYRYEKTEVLDSDNKNITPKLLVSALLLVCAYLPLYYGYVLPRIVYFVAFSTVIIISAFAIVYMTNLKKYRNIYKELFSSKTFLQVTSQDKSQILQSAYQKKLDITSDATSNKSGYAFFNEIFMKRHRKLLTRSANRIASIAFLLVIGLLGACILFPEMKPDINELTLTYLPYFLFVMYFINRGKVITQAMFMNCDHSMLTYRFYRQPKVILNLFAARLKSIIMINLLPTAVIAFSLPLLLYVTGGTDNPFNYVLLCVSIFAMSIFFSVHNMVLYYLLQPYNVNIEMKNPMFSIVNSITYVVCYLAIWLKAPTLIFGSLITAFCIIYVIVALVLAYRLAPKTFKLRQ